MIKIHQFQNKCGAVWCHFEKPRGLLLPLKLRFGILTDLHLNKTCCEPRNYNILGHLCVFFRNVVDFHVRQFVYFRSVSPVLLEVSLDLVQISWRSCNSILFRLILVFAFMFAEDASGAHMMHHEVHGSLEEKEKPICWTVSLKMRIKMSFGCTDLAPTSLELVPRPLDQALA